MLLGKGVEPLEMSAFTDVFGWASILGEESIELLDVGLSSEIETTFGLRINPNFLLTDIDLDGFDALAIPGGFEPSGFYEDALSEPFLDVIRYFSDNDRPIASVCVSSIALGHAGILKNKKATTYHQVGGKRKQQLEKTGARFIDKPIVTDGNCITSTGPGTALDVAFELLRLLTNDANTENIRRRMRMPESVKSWYETAQVSEPQ